MSAPVWISGDDRGVSDAVSACFHRGQSAIVPGDAAYSLIQFTVGEPASNHPAAAVFADVSALIEHAGLTDRGVRGMFVRKIAPGPVSLGISDGSRRAWTIAPSASTLLGLAEGFTAGALRARVLRDATHRCAESAASALAMALGAATPLDRPIGLVIDGGAPRIRGGITEVEVDPSGSVRVTGVGAYEERYITKQARVRVLFVCTGNTCRSPMAEAIARHLLAEGERAGWWAPGLVAIGSAGTAASGGQAATPETVNALRSVGVVPERHLSRSLSRGMLDDADVVWTMTRSHRAAVLSLHPGIGTSSSRTRVETLDPHGNDIEDPIGMGQRTYDETARHLRDLITVRLEELRT